MVNHFFGLISAAHISQLIPDPHQTCIYISIKSCYKFFRLFYSTPVDQLYLRFFSPHVVAAIPPLARHRLRLILPRCISRSSSHSATRPSPSPSHLSPVYLSSFPAQLFSAVFVENNPISNIYFPSHLFSAVFVENNPISNIYFPSQSTLLNNDIFHLLWVLLLYQTSIFLCDPR
jgi:hypothetical protein